MCRPEELRALCHTWLMGSTLAERQRLRKLHRLLFHVPGADLAMSGHEAVAELGCALLSQQPASAQARIGLWGQTSLLHEGLSAVRLWASCVTSSSMRWTLTCCCSPLCAHWGALMPIAFRADWVRSRQDVCVGKDLAAAQWMERRPDHSSKRSHNSLGLSSRSLAGTQCHGC